MVDDTIVVAADQLCRSVDRGKTWQALNASAILRWALAWPLPPARRSKSGVTVTPGALLPAGNEESTSRPDYPVVVDVYRVEQPRLC